MIEDVECGDCVRRISNKSSSDFRYGFGLCSIPTKRKLFRLNKKTLNQKLVKRLKSISTVDPELVSFKQRRKHQKKDTYGFC